MISIITALFLYNKANNEVVKRDSVDIQKTIVPENWKLFSSDAMGFSIQYDPTLTVDVDKNGRNEVRFYKNGPSQKGQTEMYDGMLMTIQRVAVDDGLIYIENQMNQYKEEGTLLQPLHDGMYNGISVKEYKASGLGDFNKIFITIDNHTLLEISYIVPDPTNAGFQKVVDMMLSTFALY